MVVVAWAGWAHCWVLRERAVGFPPQVLGWPLGGGCLGVLWGLASFSLGLGWLLLCGRVVVLPPRG